MGYPKKHLFVCVNEREDPCCAKTGGLEVFKALKEHVGSDMKVTKTGCMGFCSDIGTTVVVYPDGKWFHKVTKHNLKDIFNYLR